MRQAVALAALVATLGLCACSAPPRVEVPPAPMPSTYAERLETRSAHSAELQPTWWTAFADPTLNQLIERAGQGNLNLQQAVERVRLAQANLHGARAARGPTLTLDGTTSRSGGQVLNASGLSGNLFNLGATLAYEWDLLGRGRLEVEAARLDVQARQALASSTRLLVQGQVAQAYLSWRALGVERQLLQEQLKTAQDTLALSERLQRAGLSAAREAGKWRSEIHAWGQEALELERRQLEQAYALATLLGLAPAELKLPASTGSRPTVPEVPTGLPSDLLTRRADIAAAHFTAQSAAEQLGVQQRDWWPVFRLTTNGGLASLELAQWLSSAAVNWGLASALSATVLDNGRRDASREQARSQLAQAQLAYREQVLIALREVDEQLSTLRTLREQQQLSAQNLNAARQSRVQLEASRARGMVNQFDVLEARRAELRAQRSATQIEWLQAQATVALVRALGGGWSSRTDAAEALNAVVR